tara:strand:- start:267 stop:641 length:375 start_codon:yes stop_codon:yes gene_type:complete
MNFPDNLKYTKDHEWVKIDNNIAIIGITDFAQSELGDIVFVEIEKLNHEVKKDDIFGSVEAVKTVSDLFMPLTGKIIEINKKLDSNPEMINNDCYGEGWIIKVEFSNIDEYKTLLDSKSYGDII